MAAKKKLDPHAELRAVDKERYTLFRKIEGLRKELATLNKRATQLSQQIHFAHDAPAGSTQAPGAQFDVKAGHNA